MLTRNRRFELVIENLEKKGIQHKDIAEDIKARGYKISSSRISRIMNGETNLTEGIISGLKECYNINPNYLRGDSEIMILNGAEKALDSLKYIFENWNTVQKKYTQSSGKTVVESYLCFDMSKQLYDFLLKYNSISLLNMNEECSNSALETLKSIYDSEDKCEKEEYVLLPKNSFIEIIRDEKRDQKVLDEIIDIMEYEHFADDETLDVKIITDKK